MRSCLSIALLAAAPAAFAQTPPAPKPLPPIAGVSQAGMAIVNTYRGAADTELPKLVRQQRQAHQQLLAATLAAKIDPDKVAAALRQEDAAREAVRARQSEQMMAALREMPEADRAPFLRALIPSAQPAAVAR